MTTADSSSSSSNTSDPSERNHGSDTDGRDLPSTLTASPTRSLIPPGYCQFTSEFQTVPLLRKFPVSHNTAVYRFGLPDDDKSLGLSTCACILAGYENDQGQMVVRPYTPISVNTQIGSFDLLIKTYEQGKMSQHIANLRPSSDHLAFKHLNGPNVKIQAPFSQKCICMLVGGTGITPMIQALHAILGDDDGENNKEQRAIMLFGNKSRNDILGKDMLDNWSSLTSRLSVVHVLSEEKKEELPEGLGMETGFIGRELISKHFPGPEDDVLVFVCGPPPMYDALCGPREEKDEIKGVLGKMGYSPQQVYKF